MKHNIGRLGLLIVAIIWGSGFVASSIALDYYTPYQILALRFSLAFLISFTIYSKKLKNVQLKELKNGSIIGIFLFLAFLFQTVGLQFTTPSKNAFLTAVNIVIVPFLTWLILRKKVANNAYLGAFVTLIGIWFLTVDGNSLSGPNLGDILTLICAVFFALQIFYTDYYVKNIEPGVIMISQMGTAALLSWFTVFATQQINFQFSIASIMPIIYLGTVSTMVAYGIQTWAQKYVNSTEAAVILSTEAFFGMVSSAIILKENITVGMLIGALLIFIGILIVEIKPRKIKNRKLADG